MILAQLGARVIKVEMPGTGDDSRAFGPFANGKSLYFSAINYGKQSIALNLKDAADREVFEGLIGIADVLVEMGGIMSMTGQPDAPPTRVGVSIGDLAAGLYLGIGLLGAIYKRSQRGGAVKVDVAMLDCQLAFLEDALPAYLCLGEIAQPQGSRHPEIAPFQVYTTHDSYLVIAAGNDHLFGLLAQAMARPDLIENPDYKTNALRRAHVDQLEADIERTLRKRTTREWLDILNAAGVPCGPVNSIADVAKDPQVAARNMIVPIADPDIGGMKVAGNPIKLSGVPERADYSPPPALDGDRAAILAMLNKN
jgi:CoA:oxalate CoA-transferase